MKQRDALLVLASVVIAVGIAAILLVGSLAPVSPAGDRVRFFQPAPGRVAPPRPSGDFPGRVPEAFRPLVPVERGVADASRDAAGYLLVLLAVSATLVLGRDQVVATYRASLGGWRAQARVLGAGVAALALIASATFLTGVVFLGTLTGGLLGQRAFGPPGLAPMPPAALQFGLQAGFVALSVLFFLVALPALVGFAAASWRLGDSLLGLPRVLRWGARVPAPLVAVFGATLLYLLAQVPYLGIVSAICSLAYALGAVVTARLDPAGHVRPGPDQAS